MNLALSGSRGLLFVSTLIIGLLVLAGLGVLLWRIYRGPGGIEDVETIPLSQVLAAVKRELRAAETAGGSNFLPLSAVKLELHVVTQTDTQGTVKPVLLPMSAFAKLAATEEVSRTQKVAVTLEPPKPDLTQGGIDLSDLGLAAAIKSVREDLQQGINEPPRLEPTQVTIELAFGVKRSLESSAGVELEVIEAGASDKYLTSSLQKITLEFKHPKSEAKAGEEKQELAWEEP
jgi:hypothetical protein